MLPVSNGMKYLCDPHVIPAVMARDISDLEASVAQCAAFATWLHLDIMDGLFAPNPHWPFGDPYQKIELERLGSGEVHLPSGIAYEVHLMTKAPTALGVAFARAGAARVLGHIEAFATPEEARDALAAWKSAGASEVGLSLKLATPLSALDPLVDGCDVVQIMSIADIGFQGKPFDEHALSRIEELHATYPDLMVAADGGVSEATVESLVRAGANRLVVGGAIMKSINPAKAYARIHERAMLGCVPVESTLEVANS